MKIHLVGAELFHTDGRTDWQTYTAELRVAFLNLANLLNNVWSCGLDLFCLGCIPVACFCKHSNEILGSTMDHKIPPIAGQLVACQTFSLHLIRIEFPNILEYIIHIIIHFPCNNYMWKKLYSCTEYIQFALGKIGVCWQNNDLRFAIEVILLYHYTCAHLESENCIPEFILFSLRVLSSDIPWCFVANLLILLDTECSDQAVEECRRAF
jgi:hypothetical protein